MKKNTIPEFLKNIDTSSFKSFMETARIDKMEILAYDGIRDIRPYGDDFNKNAVKIEPASKHHKTPAMDERIIDLQGTNISFGGTRYKVTLLYFDDDGSAWINNLTMESTVSYGSIRYGYIKTPQINADFTVALDEWKKITRYTQYNSTIQSKNEILKIAEKCVPYAIEYANEKEFCIEDMLMAPYLEILSKAGYAIADSILHKQRIGKSEYEAFGRLCKPGNNPKEIFRVSPLVYKTLRKETDISKWDSIRKLESKTLITKEMMQLIAEPAYQYHFTEICEILKAQYDGKQVFTPRSLMKYLERLNAYEAIEADEAFPLIKDYLSLCKTAGKKPIITGDSLKREHDVTLRLCREVKSEKYANDIRRRGKELEDKSYQEANYFIRPITDFDDLLDESMQQGNCLAAVYPAYIASGYASIFVMRETRHPNKSLATVELRSDGTLGQHYLSHNRQMTNKAQLDFLKRWLKAIA